VPIAMLRRLLVQHLPRQRFGCTPGAWRGGGH
jgi:hypothetical protein